MKQIKIGIILNYVSIVLTFVIGLIYTPFLIRTLGQNDYGLYAFVFAIAGYLAILDIGIGNSIVRYISSNTVSGDKEKEKRIIGYFFKLFSYVAVLTLILGILIAFNIEVIVSNNFPNDSLYTLKWMILILTFNFALGFIFNTFASVIQAYEKYIFLKVLNVVRTLAVPIFSTIALFNTQNLVLLTLILFIVNSIVSICYFVYYKRVLRLSLSFEELNKDFKKEIFSYAVIIFIVAIADKMYWQTDQILLGILKSPEDVAIYAVAIQFVNIFMSLSLAISNVFLPRITKIVNAEHYSVTEINILYIKVSKYQTFVMGLAFSGFIILGRDFIELWVGPKYELAYFLVVILMSTFFIDLIQNLGLTVMQAKGKYSFRAYTLIICAVLNVIISVPIIKIYGSIGTAYITAAFILLGNVIILNIYFHSVLKLNMLKYWNEIGRIILIIVLITLVSKIFVINLDINTWIMFFSVSLVYLAIYVVFLFLFYASIAEKKKIISHIKSVNFRIKR
ncbi:oligosaccharide flippase family protein [Caryophanon latum]|uniref:Polysaccharide biosynthesis protein C-terminal domain-containing protein n=1 Tax=Caryophanon latum TaxID=33977 RepID=A0A1C0YIT3_9BACL|nr:oligosaccharide flippase family protein [Caryophanon latum]OCS87051.1 hypothetical protein A6K76_14045 [Caryophanon latum]